MIIPTTMSPTAQTKVAAVGLLTAENQRRGKRLSRSRFVRLGLSGRTLGLDSLGMEMDGRVTRKVVGRG